MKAFVYLVRGLAIVLAVISLPLIIFGWGLFITGGMVFFLFTSNALLGSLNDLIPMTKNQYLMYTIGIITACISSLVAIYVGDAVGHIDTGGHHYPFLIGGAIVAFVITVALLIIGSKSQKLVLKR